MEWYTYGFIITAQAHLIQLLEIKQVGVVMRMAFIMLQTSTTFYEIRGIQSGVPGFGFYNTGNLCEITFIGSEAYPQGIYNTSNTTIINFGVGAFNDLQKLE